MEKTHEKILTAYGRKVMRIIFRWALVALAVAAFVTLDLIVYSLAGMTVKTILAAVAAILMVVSTAIIVKGAK